MYILKPSVVFRLNCRNNGIEFNIGLINGIKQIDLTFVTICGTREQKYMTAPIHPMAYPAFSAGV